MQTNCKWCNNTIIGSEERDITQDFHVECATALCKNCGLCCHTLLIPTRFEWSDMDSRIFYEKRGIQTVKDNMGGITLVMSNSPCKLFTKGKGCQIYEDRPYWCQVYEPKNDPFHASMCPLCPEYEGEMPKK